MSINGTPGPEQGWTDSVQIREVGGPPGREQERFPVPSGGAAGPESRPQRPSRAFRGAWILTGVLLAIGLLGIGGAFENATTQSNYGSTVTFDPKTGRSVPPELPPLTVQLRNMGYAAPMMLQTGLASAAALLIIRGLRRSREQHPAPVLGQERSRSRDGS